jgi:hypothetical protein
LQSPFHDDRHFPRNFLRLGLRQPGDVEGDCHVTYCHCYPRPGPGIFRPGDFPEGHAKSMANPRVKGSEVAALA